MPHTPPILETPPGPRVRIDGREYRYFAGTSYLGLQGRREVIRAACEAVEQFGLHSATSRTGFGTTRPTLAVEQRAAAFFDAEAAMVLPTGYASNDVMLGAIADEFDAIFLDEYSHYCEFDAARRSGRPIATFRHADAGDLAQKLRELLPPAGRPLVITDGVFAVRGAIAPIADYVDVLRNYPGAALMIDDAHGVGVLGEHGRGTFEHFGMFDAGVNRGFDDACPPALPCPAKNDATGGESEPSLFLTATLSKALGGYGGILPGSRPFVERLRRSSHWFDGATPPPAPTTAASARAIEIAVAEPDLRRRLQANVRQMRSGLRAAGFDVADLPTPILCLTAADAGSMQRIQRELFARGIVVAYIAHYAGLGELGGLRIAVFATHDEADIEHFLDEIAKFL